MAPFSDAKLCVCKEARGRVTGMQRMIMSKLAKQPLFWAWAFVVLWATHSIYTAIVGHWIGLVISLTGLVAALLVVSAFQSRRRKNYYPSHALDDTVTDARR
jgi:hypothetical protein